MMLSLTRTALHSSLPRRTISALTRPFTASSTSFAKRPQAAAQAALAQRDNHLAASLSPSEPDSYALASRLRTLLSSSSQLPSALLTLRTAPKQAATVVVWNVLLNCIFHFSASQLPQEAQAGTAAGEGWRVKKAWEVWMEMKRRGVTPSARSYGTFLGGAAKAAKRLEEGKKGESFSGEVRGRVEAVHKQWVQHCERVVEEADRADVAAGSPGRGKKGGKRAAKATADGQAGLDAAFEEPFGSALEEPESADGKLDTLDDLSPHPTNQFLAFLSSHLTTCASTPAGPPTLDLLLCTFEAMPHPSSPGLEPNPLARSSISYTLAFSALRTALSVPPSPLPPSPSTPSFPSPADLLQTALRLYSTLLSCPPSSAASQSPQSYLLTSLPPTLFLQLFLTPSRSSSSLPAPLWAEALQIAQDAFGFVPPSSVASLTPPYPSFLSSPYAGALDAHALGASMKVAVAAGKAGWARGWWEQVRDYPERFGLPVGEEGEKVWRRDVATTENAEVVVKASGMIGDVEGVEDMLSHLHQNPHHPPTVHTFTTALSSLHRIGTLSAFAAAFRVWDALLLHSSSSGASSRKAAVAARKERKGKEVAAKEDLSGNPASSMTEPQPRKEHAAAATALLRLAIAVRDRSQVWRALKAVSGPSFSSSSPPSPSTPPSASSPRQAPSSSFFSPSCFPPSSFVPSSSSSKAVKDVRSKDLALSQALLLALERLLKAPVDKFSLPSSEEEGGEGLKEVLEKWEERLKDFVEAASGGGGGGGGAEGEMATRRARLVSQRGSFPQARSARSSSSNPKEQDSEGGDKREYRRGPNGKVMRRERRDGWWEANKERVEGEMVEREVFGRDARGRVPGGEERRERLGERRGRREEREERPVRRRFGEKREDDRYPARSSFSSSRPPRERDTDRPRAFQRRDRERESRDDEEDRYTRKFDGPKRKGLPSREDKRGGGRTGQKSWEDMEV
ncbi:hypothetical protein JCM8547_004092 [Rhodosporidiobolus lusitaniae]